MRLLAIKSISVHHFILGTPFWLLSNRLAGLGFQGLEEAKITFALDLDPRGCTGDMAMNGGYERSTRLRGLGIRYGCGPWALPTAINLQPASGGWECGMVRNGGYEPLTCLGGLLRGGLLPVCSMDVPLRP